MVTTLSLVEDSEFVRGYNSTGSVNLTFTNTHALNDIYPVDEEETNFNVTLWLTSGDMRSATQPDVQVK